MRFPPHHFSLLKESRLIHERESSFGEHMKDYLGDIGDTYVTQSIKRKDPIGMATGAVMVPLSLLLEGTDQVYSGIVGQKYNAPAGIAGRTTRDIGLLLKDVVTLHPLRALGDAWRIGTSDWILDAGDAVGGHRISTRSSLKTALQSQNEYHVAP